MEHVRAADVEPEPTHERGEVMVMAEHGSQRQCFAGGAAAGWLLAERFCPSL